ncbi:EAL domain-containing protein [Pseudothauera lacus]|uniref:protein-glutamate O-methyltransferase n=1 Tax=Pseudothauera lacus TaxID=2136175 RepID=A0A2T4IHJ9_9RHOO|nr:EAL domain-containing protein [Pseudothauera lacus]PTD97254.1 PAS domain S-box protein [Pseudothauera lacus]
MATKKPIGMVSKKADDTSTADAPPRRARARRKSSVKANSASNRPIYLVGIGASAGGLEALSNLIAALPTDLGLAYAVIQHLSPTHRSMMAQLLGRETAMAVKEITDGMEPERDTIYVTPPSSNMVLREGRFVLQDEPKSASPRPSVNAFFSSLAAEKGEDAIGVVLSGTGSDGAVGLREIKAVGGYTFAQEPQSAKYNGMPQAAIDTGCVDWVLPAEEIAREIAQIARSKGSVAVSPPAATTTLKKLLIRVKQQTRIDFGNYKEGTIWRRIERRLAARHVSSLDDYLALVEADPSELDHLCKDILISVTAFFRDPAAFEALRTTLQALLATKHFGDEIRIWVPGCATGEEAYSIAILLAELLGPNLSQFRVQIFATDLDLNALAVARRGAYPETALSDMDPALVTRHFSNTGNRYEVSRTLRDMVVVARQDLVQDPPFLRLDLVSCRNVLIYFQTELQAKVLGTFHYGLRPGGYLFLGKSEGVFQQIGQFDPSDKTARIYRRRPGESRLMPMPTFHLPDNRERPSAQQPNAQQRLLDASIKLFIPPTILINAAFEILHIQGEVGDFLSISAGKPTTNLQQLIRREFRADLNLMVHQVERSSESASGRPHLIKTVDGKRRVLLSVHPLEKGVTSSFFLIAFETPPVEKAPSGDSKPDATQDSIDVKALEEELISTRERLQTVIEELETSNEEMQALNEEVQAANEELQSTNEELESANEELQSTNEELTTVNEELQVRSGELAEALNDLEKIQNSVGFPILVCNENMELSRFNSPAIMIFLLTEKSMGQPLPTLRLPFGMKDFSPQVRRAIDTNQSIEEAVFSNERHYLLHIAPYETTRPGSRGAIISLMDHTERLAAERAIRESRERLQAIMDNSTSMISLKDLAGRYEFVNRQFEKTFGLKSADVIGKTDAQLFIGRNADHFRSKELEVVRRQEAIESEEVLRRADGDRYLLSIRFPLFGIDNVIQGVCTQSSDMTDRRHAEEQLRLAARVFDRAGEGIVVTDPQQRILTVNEAFTQVTGYTIEEVSGKTPALLSSGRHGNDFYLEMWEALQEKGWWQGEIWNRRKSGEIFPEWLTINTVHDSDGALTNYVGIFSDITVIKDSQRRIEFLATHDELTSLPNRTLFVDRVRQAIERAKRHEDQFAILFVDLDNFKVINDSLGHAAGDKLLKEAASTLRQCLRAVDTVARFGGDEFALLIEETNAVEVDVAARRIADALGRSVDIGGHDIFVSASIGISIYPDDGSDSETLLKNADSAMYQAKEAGKHTHRFFTSNLKDQADERLLLGNGLKRAIDSDELFLLYQPQIDMTSGVLIGMEALVRWQEPKTGLIMPNKFIPLAERSGLINHVGDWVADAACRQVAAWTAQGYDVPRISINVSAEQFRQSHLPSTIRRLLTHYRLEAHQLTIELTESALMADPEHCRRLLRDLKVLGVGLSIDDFGTGFSSLSSLRRYPIDELKIDRSFIDELVSNPDDRAITQTILAMASTLGLSVVAEGVETEHQARTLREMACPAGQGYLYARPLTATEMCTRLALRP